MGLRERFENIRLISFQASGLDGSYLFLGTLLRHLVLRLRFSLARRSPQEVFWVRRFSRRRLCFHCRRCRSVAFLDYGHGAR